MISKNELSILLDDKLAPIKNDLFEIKEHIMYIKTMTEPTYELNTEKLESLSIADLSAIITLHKLYPSGSYSKILVKVASIELDKRINDIIIF